MTTTNRRLLMAASRPIDVLRKFTFDTTGGEAGISTCNAFIKKIKGSTIVWNQFVDYSNIKKYGVSGISVIVNNGVISINTETAVSSGSGIELNYYTPIIGHKYLISAFVDNTNGNVGINYRCGTNAYSIIDSVGIKVNLKTILTAINTNTPLIWKNTEDIPIDWSISKYKIFDLTLMFGAGNEPATVAEFEAMFPLDYYDYNAGQLLSFTGDDIKTTGFNQWDEQWELGEINADTGANTNASSVWRTKNYIPILPNTSYYNYCALQGTPSFRVRFYDANKNYIGYLSKSGQQVGFNSVFTTPTNAHYLRFAPNVSAVPTGTPVCINISHNGTKNGTYEEYEQHTKDISFYKSIKDGQGNTLFPYGLLSAGSVYDEVTENKAIKRIGVVDMGSMSWSKSTYGSVDVFLAMYGGATTFLNLITSRYINGGAINASALQNKMFRGHNGSPTIYVRDDDYTTTSAFKAAVQGVMLYYELAEPIEVPLDNINLEYPAYRTGTEELLPANGAVPTTTPALFDIRYKIGGRRN